MFTIFVIEKVMLWLGANVMLEYDATEAQTLLTNNKENAVKSLEDVREQLGKTFKNHMFPSKSSIFSLFARSNDHNGSVNGPCLQLGRK